MYKTFYIAMEQKMLPNYFVHFVQIIIFAKSFNKKEAE